MHTVWQNKKKNGFSLIELLVVATIIILLTTIGIATFQNAGRNARDGKRKADLESVRQSLVLYRSDTGGYPVTTSYSTMTTTLVGSNYLSQPVPTDPKTGTTGYSYTYTSGGGTSFCLCALSMENASNASNPTGCSVTGGSNSYCLVNP